MEIAVCLKTFLLTNFEDDYDERLPRNFGGIYNEIELYFKDGKVGGWSSWYCKMTWNDSTLENEADLEIFDLLFEIDIKNGADTSKIVDTLCSTGAFEAVKVRLRQNYRVIKSLTVNLPNPSFMFIYNQISL